jgi:hypothetical protein
LHQPIEFTGLGSIAHGIFKPRAKIKGRVVVRFSVVDEMIGKPEKLSVTFSHLIKPTAGSRLPDPLF